MLSEISLGSLLVNCRIRGGGGGRLQNCTPNMWKCQTPCCCFKLSYSVDERFWGCVIRGALAYWRSSFVFSLFFSCSCFPFNIFSTFMQVSRSPFFKPLFQFTCKSSEASHNSPLKPAACGIQFTLEVLSKTSSYCAWSDTVCKFVGDLCKRKHWKLGHFRNNTWSSKLWLHTF